jgi:hypothetical protein
MNEKLKEIAVKAQVEHCVSHVRLQEFAELIVRECIDVVSKATTSPNGYQALMKHFGVEE